MTGCDETTDELLEEDIDAIIAFCGGNYRKTIRTLLEINCTLQEINTKWEKRIEALEAAASKGFGRGVGKAGTG